VGKIVTRLAQALMAALLGAQGAAAIGADVPAGNALAFAPVRVESTASLAAQADDADDEQLDGNPAQPTPTPEPAAAADGSAAPADDEPLDQGPPPAAATDDEPLDQGPPPVAPAAAPAPTSAPVPAPPPAAAAPTPSPGDPGVPVHPVGGVIYVPFTKAYPVKSTWPFDDGGGVFVNAGFGPGEEFGADGFDSCSGQVSNGRAYVGVGCDGADVVAGFTPPPWLADGEATAAQRSVLRPSASSLAPSQSIPISAPTATTPRDDAADADGNTVVKEGRNRTRTRTVTVERDGDAVTQENGGGNGQAENRSADNGATQTSRERNSAGGGNDNNNGSGGGNGNNNGNAGGGNRDNLSGDGGGNGASRSDGGGNSAKSQENQQPGNRDEKKDRKRNDQDRDRGDERRDERGAERTSKDGRDGANASADRQRSGQRPCKDRADGPDERDSCKADRKKQRNNR
jgi:hypothetical protein